MAAQILRLEELAPRLSRFDRLMGLDIGMKTIGLALSDVERRLASPLVTIRRTRFSEDAAALLKRAAEFHVAALVIGLPLNMDGSEGPRAQSTRAFVRNLPDSVSMSYWDERLSTAAVTRELIAQDASRKKRAEVVDRMAAAYILQGALDRLARIATAK
jgi:putative pre-16S rRNA nuclease